MLGPILLQVFVLQAFACGLLTMNLRSGSPSARPGLLRAPPYPSLPAHRPSAFRPSGPSAFRSRLRPLLRWLSSPCVPGPSGPFRPAPSVPLRFRSGSLPASLLQPRPRALALPLRRTLPRIPGLPFGPPFGHAFRLRPSLAQPLPVLSSGSFPWSSGHPLSLPASAPPSRPSLPLRPWDRLPIPPTFSDLRLRFLPLSLPSPSSVRPFRLPSF